MAGDVNIKITADAKSAEAAFARLKSNTHDLSAGFGKLSDSLARIGSLFASAFAVGSLKSTIDGFTQLQSRLAIVEDSLAGARDAFQGVFAIAQKAGQDVASVAEVYQRIGRNARQLGLDQKAALETTQAVANAVKLSGASAASAQAALVQFGQALASGTLRGDELNSVMEQTPALAEAIARGMGKTVGDLRKLGEAGKLTAQDVIVAIRNEAARLEAESNRMGSTIGMSLTRISNAWQKYLGENTSGAVRVLTSALDALAENLGKVANAALALGAGLSAAKFAGWISGAGGLVAALMRINPVTAGIGLAVTALGIAFQDWQRKGEAAADSVRDALEKLRSSAARVSADIAAMSGDTVKKSVADIERQRDAEIRKIERLKAELSSIEAKTRTSDAKGRVTGYDVDAIRRRDALQAEILGAEQALAGLNKELDGIRANMRMAGTREIDAYFKQFGSKAEETKAKLKDLEEATEKALKAARARVASGIAGQDEIDRIRKNYEQARAEILKSSSGKADTQRLPRIVETFDAELAALRAHLKTAEDMLEAAFKARLVKEENYWQAKGEMQRRALDLEAQDLARQIADQQRIISRKGETAENIERAKNKLAELQIKMAEIDGRRMVVDLDIKTNLDRVRQELEDLKASLREKIAEATGEMTPEMRRAAIERTYRETLQRIGDDAESAALVQRAIDVEAAKAEMTALESAWRLALETMQNAEQSANIQREQGLLTTAEAQRQIAEAHAAAARAMDDLLPKMEAVAKTLGPQAQAQVEAFKNVLLGIKTAIDPLEKSLQTSIKGAFEDMFTAIGTGAKTAKEAFLDFARSVIAAIQRIFAQQLAEKLFGKGGLDIGGLFGGLFGGSAGGGGRRGQTPADAVYVKNIDAGGDLVEKGLRDLGDGTEGGFGLLGETFAKLMLGVRNIFGSIMAGLSSIVSGLSGLFTGGMSGISSAVNGIGSALGQGVSGIANMISSLGQGMMSGFSSLAGILASVLGGAAMASNKSGGGMSLGTIALLVSSVPFLFGRGGGFWDNFAFGIFQHSPVRRFIDGLFDKVFGWFDGFSFSSLFSGFKSFFSSIFSLFSFSRGGYVSGPGTSTSDSIPARLSAGEYVIRADAVRRFGVAFLDAINGLRLPPVWNAGRLAFAAGGMVPAVAAPIAQQNIRIVNAVDPELARDWMESPGGERVIMNILSRNAGAVRNIVGA